MAINNNDFELFKFTYSDEIMDLFKYYNENYNPNKDLWDKYKIIEKMNEQFSDKYYESVLEKICTKGNENMLDFMLNVMKIDEKYDEIIVNTCLSYKQTKLLKLFNDKDIKLLTYDNLLKIYEYGLLDDEFIKKQLSKYTKHDYEKIYSEDKDLTLFKSAYHQNLDYVLNLLHTGYNLSQHNKYYQSICQCLYSIGNNENFEKILDIYCNEKLVDYIYSQYIYFI